MSDANEGAPTLRDVLETAECSVKLVVLDHPENDLGFDRTYMTAESGQSLVHKLERSRVLAGNALLACRPKLRLDTNDETHQVLVLEVLPFGMGTEGRA